MVRFRAALMAGLFAASAGYATAKAPIFEEVDGIVVMEIESGVLAGQHAWKGEKQMEGYTGKGYYTWRGGNLFSNPGQGIIAFRFRIAKDGKYQMRIRNRHDFRDSTLENDCWTKVDNGKWIKTFSSQRGKWTWRTNHEPGHGKKPPASYEFKAGTHVLMLSGRSAGFSLDRIHLYRDGIAAKTAENEKLPETRVQTKAAGSQDDEAKPEANEEPTVAAKIYPVRQGKPTIEGPRRIHHPLTISLDGPALSEAGSPNPFTDFRMTATFSQGDRRIVACGYYAADGHAGETSASSGRVWKAHFLPPTAGKWNVTVSFRQGPGIAIDDAPQAGKPAALDGTTAVIDIAGPGKSPAGFLGKGPLRYVGKRYLQFAGSGEWFIKGGADSPENLLGYADFDGTRDTKGNFLHRYSPHVRDWRPGDPTWRAGKGKGLIGAINYLASTGMNSVYFIPYNIDRGDGGDTWPWTDAKVRDRFDCSKLDQWQIVFGHMQSRGLAMHVILQETENDQAMDGGDLGPVRKLYLREMIARFAHNPAIVWNLGEENTNTTAQQKAIATYIRALDACDHPIVVHTFPGKQEQIYRPLLGFQALEGPSLQTSIKGVHAETIKWIDASAKGGRQWFVCSDEIGPANTGVKPDADDPAHDEIRYRVLWGNLLAGGAGCEYYFGYKFAHNDLNCEDWRSRDAMWNQTAVALKFFHDHLPFTEMNHADELTTSPDAWCLAKPGEVYAVYLRAGDTTRIDLPAGQYSVSWLNPRTGGKLKPGGALTTPGEGTPPDLPAPPDKNDWVALIRKTK